MVVAYRPEMLPSRARNCLIYATAESRITGPSGSFELTNLPAGEYVITAYAAEVRWDFNLGQSEPVVLRGNETIELNFSLSYDDAIAW